MTLRIWEREVDSGILVTQLCLQPNIVGQGYDWLKIIPPSSMATVSHTQWWFVRPKSAGDHQGVV